MRRLNRYIVRSIAAPFLFSFGACTGLLMVNQIARQFSELVGKDLAPAVIVEFLLLALPFIIALTLPMAVLIAILYAYSQLGADSEITAMRANGVSVAQMIRPAIIVGLVLGIVCYFFVDQLLPRANARFGRLRDDIRRTKPAFVLREQTINNVPPYAIRAAVVYPGSGRLKDVEIFDLSVRNARGRITYADSGSMALISNGPRMDLILQLFNGRTHEYSSQAPSEVRITMFDKNIVRAQGVQNSFTRETTNLRIGDREMTVCQMADELSIQKENTARAKVRLEDITRRDLRAIMRLAQVQPDSEPPIQGTRHCGVWRKAEAAIGRWIIPDSKDPEDAGEVEEINSFELPPRQIRIPNPDTAGVVPLASIPETINARQAYRIHRTKVSEYAVEIYKKHSISLACLTFVLLAVPLALRLPRGGMGLVIGGGLSIFSVFYVGLVGGEVLGDANRVSPVIAMFLPNAVVAAAGLIGLLIVSRGFGSTRGGDFAEILDILFGRFRRRRNGG